METTLGFVKMTDDEYFASEGLSNSFLIQFDRSPMHALTGIEKTKAMTDGTMLHKFILENDDFYNQYVVAPEGMKDRRLKEYKDFSKDQTKEIILFDDLKKLEVIRDNVMKYQFDEWQTLGDLLSKGKSEMAFFWEDDISGDKVLRKAKADNIILGETQNIIFDVKKTENCLDFWKSVRNYRYDRQAQSYSAGVEVITKKPTLFYFITVEMTAPYGVKVYQLSDDMLEQSMIDNANSILEYIEWDKAGRPEKLYAEGVEIIGGNK